MRTFNDDVNDPVKRHHLIMFDTVIITDDMIFFFAGAVQQCLTRFRRIIAQWCVQRKAVRFADFGDQRPHPCIFIACLESVALNGALPNGKRRIGNQFARGKDCFFSEPRTVGACAKRIVKREHTRCQFSHGKSVFFTRIVLRKMKFFLKIVDRCQQNDVQISFRQCQRCLNGITQA